MFLLKTKRSQKGVYGMRMESVWKAYGTRAKSKFSAKINKSALLTVLLGTLAISAPQMATAQGKLNIGDIFECEAKDGLPPVEIWVGKIDRMNFSSASGNTSVLVVHVEAKGKGDEFPTLNHAPFRFEALGPCLSNKISSRKKTPAEFKAAYKKWQAGVNSSKSPFLDQNPADIYWSALGKQ